jgi:hypothetical protein
MTSITDPRAAMIAGWARCALYDGERERRQVSRAVLFNIVAHVA